MGKRMSDLPGEGAVRKPARGEVVQKREKSEGYGIGVKGLWGNFVKTTPEKQRRTQRTKAKPGREMGGENDPNPRGGEFPSGIRKLDPEKCRKKGT